MEDTIDQDKKNLVDQLPETAYDAINGGGKRQTFAKKTVIGEFRNPLRFTWVEWVFLVVTSISILGVFSLTVERFVSSEKNFHNLTYFINSTARPCMDWYCTADFILSVVLLVNLAFCLFYCCNALFRERKFELLAFVSAIVIIAGYIIGNYIYSDISDRPIRLVKKVRLGLVCFFGPLNVILAFASWWKMGYLIFDVIGSNAKLIRAYNIRSFFITLQYFHLEIMANIFVLSFASNGLLISTAEKVVLTLFLVFLIAIVFLGSIAVLWELLVPATIWYISMFLMILCYIYKLAEVSMNWSSYTLKYEEYQYMYSSQSSLIYVGAILLIAVILGLLVSVLLIFTMWFVIRNFKAGLADKIDPPFKNCVVALKRNKN